MLLHAFVACPEHLNHTRMIFFPLFQTKVTFFYKHLSVPPTIKVNVAFSAPPTPPETGASRDKKVFLFHIFYVKFLLYLHQ